MRFPMLTVLAGSVFVTGCSWMTDFAVSNRTEGEIYVKYSYLKSGQPCPLAGEPPEIISIESVGRWKPRAWIDSPEGAYQVDAGACSVEVTLQPGRAVRIAEGHDIPSDLELTIGSPAGGVTLSGEELARSFSKRSPSFYELAYTKDGVGGEAGAP